MSNKEKIAWFEQLKDNIVSRIGNKSTNSGFRQVMRKLDSINREIDKLSGKNKK